MFSTYLGGSDNESGHGITLGPKGDIYVVGGTQSADFPTQKAFQPELSAPASGSSLPFLQRDAFLVRLAPDAKSLIYSTFYGRSSTIDQAWDVQ